MAIILSLLTALLFGTSDFFGGMAGKRIRIAQVLLCAHITGGIGIFVISLAIADQFRLADLGWGAIAGASGIIGLGLLYRGLARGPMGVVGALTAITSATVPAVWGTLVDGDELAPWAWIGVGIALVAIGLVSWSPNDSNTRVTGRTIVESLIAGAGFGFMFILLNHSDPASAPWPIVGARVLTAPVILASFLVRRSQIWPRDPVAFRLVLGVGFLDTISNALFLYAAQRGSLTGVAVLSSLYPVATVILARTVLHERLTHLQLGGFVLAMGATAMIAAG